MNVRCVVTCVAVVLLAGCGQPAGPPKATVPLRLATYFWPGFYWIDVARDRGWFRAEGLDIDFVDSNADYVASLDAVVSGRLDFSGFTLFDLIRYNVNGSDLVMIVVTDQSAGADAVAARPGIARLSDLRGKRIGVPLGTYGEYILATLLQREGIPSSAYKLVDIQGERAAPELGAGSIDAAVTWEPFAGQAAAAVNGQRIWDSSQLPGISPGGLVTRRALLNQRGDDTQAIVRVWHRATRFIAEHPEEAYAIVARAQHQTTEDVRAFVALDTLVDLRANLVAMSYASGFDSLHGAARVIVDFLITQQRAARRLDSSQFLDARFLKALP